MIGIKSEKKKLENICSKKHSMEISKKEEKSIITFNGTQ